MPFPLPTLPLLFTLALNTPAPSSEVNVDGTLFPSRVVHLEVPLQLHRAKLFRYLGVLKAYAIALYLPEGKGVESLQVDSPRRLELSYRVPIKGPDFGKGAAPILKRQNSPERLASLQPRLDRINALYRDVRPGDRYALTYFPGRGTELALNNQSLGVIEGADFAAAYFAIWLGPKALDEGLRRDLLGMP